MSGYAKAVATAVAGWFMMQYGPELAKTVRYYINRRIITSIKVRRNSTMSYSLLQHINKVLNPDSPHIVIDGHNYVVPNGIYNFRYQYSNGSSETIRVEITDEHIEVYMYVWFRDAFDRSGEKIAATHRSNRQSLQKFIDEVHTSYTDPAHYIIQFIMQDDGSWSSPIVKQHRNIIGLTPEMTDADNKITDFLNPATKANYHTRGIAYRYGILLCGESGTGKSTVAELIAQKHRMDMYCINLISEKMTDALLQQSCVTINKQSLIVIDEFDKMYNQIGANNKTKVTMAGILSAIDGVIRLPEGCIVIVIMNGKLNDVITNPVHRAALVRPGRLDKCVEFNTAYAP